MTDEPGSVVSSVGPVDPDDYIPCSVHNPNHPAQTCDRRLGHTGDHEYWIPGTLSNARWPASEVAKDIPKDLLTIAQIRRLGAMEAEETRLEGTTQFLASQRVEYLAHSKDDLIDELLRRDESALKEGRGLADGRIAGNLLREFVRGILHTADAAALKQIEGFARDGQIQAILELLGADPVDRRQLRTEGSMLGTGQTSEEREAAIEQLPDVERTAPKLEVADAVREFHAEHHVKGSDAS